MKKNNSMYQAILAAKRVLSSLQFGLTMDDFVSMVNEETNDFSWSQDVAFMATMSTYGLYGSARGKLYNNGFMPPTTCCMWTAAHTALTKRRFPLNWGYIDSWGDTQDEVVEKTTYIRI